LIYDDQRLIGNLDWLQQARRFDMALLKTMHKGWQIDLGYAFNQTPMLLVLPIHLMCRLMLRLILLILWEYCSDTGGNFTDGSFGKCW
jgi:hypothetical protein